MGFPSDFTLNESEIRDVDEIMTVQNNCEFCGGVEARISE